MLEVINFVLKTNIRPRVKSALRALFKAPDAMEMTVGDFIRLWGPGRITTFVSIGANDGITNDPLGEFIEPYHWKGIMVEPLRSNFEKLVRNFSRNHNIVLENVGITKRPGTFDFYYVRNASPDEPDWYDQVASFDKTTFYKNVSVEPSLLNRVGVSPVRCITFEMLLKKHSLEPVDLLMIDAEGYDYEILSSIDLQKHMPGLIVFEYEWLTNYDRKAALAMLKQAGYRTISNGFDCVAIK